MDSSTILAANRDVRILAPDSEPIGQLTLGPRTDDQPKRTLKIVHDVSRQPLEDKSTMSRDIALAPQKRPRQDSNLRHRLRRPVLYPLSYGGTSRGRS